MITASIICDSLNIMGTRLTTFLLDYPRFIHSELMTHRAFARNAASSRAIPIEKMIEAADNAAVPERYGSNKAGMQAGEELSMDDSVSCVREIQSLKSEAIQSVLRMSEKGLHKQIANRYLEPWSHIRVVVSATDKGFANFFGLRADPMAQPEFQVLAYRMLDQYLKGQPKQLPWGAWHIPFQENPERIISGPYENNGKIIEPAVGRIARVSFMREDSVNREDNTKVFHRCRDGGHWSPFEHVAMAWGTGKRSNFDVGYDNHFCGWRQFRKNFDDELRSPDLFRIMDNKPDWITL